MPMQQTSAKVYVGLPDFSGERRMNIDTGRLRFEFQYSTEELTEMVREGFGALAPDTKKKLLAEFNDQGDGKQPQKQDAGKPLDPQDFGSQEEYDAAVKGQAMRGAASKTNEAQKGGSRGGR